VGPYLFSGLYILEISKEEAESSCILGVSNVIGVDDNATDLIIEGFVFKISDILTKVFIRDIMYKNRVRIKI
jgi:hypothetical protein